MTEPDVAITNFFLALECAAFAVWLSLRGARAALRHWLVLFFACAGVAALLGGVVHGFFADPASDGARILWPLTLLAVGFSALAGWALAATISLSPSARRAVVVAACVQLAIYSALLFSGYATFLLAIADYAPAALALLAATAWRARRGDLPGSSLAGWGVALTLGAPVVQQSGVDLHPYFTHNAAFHVVQSIGFALFFAGVRHWVSAITPTAKASC